MDEYFVVVLLTNTSLNVLHIKIISINLLVLITCHIIVNSGICLIKYFARVGGKQTDNVTTIFIKIQISISGFFFFGMTVEHLNRTNSIDRV